MSESKKHKMENAKKQEEQAAQKNSEQNEQDAESENKETESTQPPMTEEEKMTARVAELEDKLLRTAAEFDNYKKRIARNYEDMLRQANENIICELLEIMDNFERAMQHGNDGSEGTGFREGVELIFNQLKTLLEKYNVTPIEAVGKTFDPNLHEALMQIESDEHPEGVVAVEVSRGYKQGDRVIRHAKVGVSKGKPEKTADESAR